MFKIFFAICCFFSVANAQSPKASEFYPLQVGNVWQYQSINQSDLGSEQSVVGDTTLGDSILIYEVLARSFQTNGRVFEDVGYLAYNEDSTIVYAMSTLRQDLLFLKTTTSGSGAVKWFYHFIK